MTKLRIQCVSLLLLVFISLSWASVSARDEDGLFCLENECVALSITAKGGKIVRFFDKGSSRELLDETRGTYSGVGKSRDLINMPLDMLTSAYELKIIENTAKRVAVSAFYRFSAGKLKGLELTRTFTLSEGLAAVKIDELYACREQPSNFAINWHAMIPTGKTDLQQINTFSGTTGVDLAKGMSNQNNIFPASPQAPYIATLDSSSGNGTILIVSTSKEVANYFCWVGASTGYATLETYFKDVRLRPETAADEWAVSGYFAPFSGRGRVVGASPEAVLSIALVDGRRQASIFLLKTLGPGECKVNQRVIPAEFTAGKTVEVELPEGAVELQLSTRSSDIVFNLAADAGIGKLLEPTNELPKRSEKMENIGFYYAFPTLYLSDEIPAEIFFGLRGDFSLHSKKNFRLALALPEGVALTPARFSYQPDGTMEIDGKTYHKWNIPSFRTRSYTGALPINLVLQAGFQSNSSLYFFAEWDDGRCEPARLPIEKIPVLPKVQPLKEFRIGIGDNLYHQGRPVLNWGKIGVNFFNFFDYLPTIMYDNHYPDGVYAERIESLRTQGLDSQLNLGLPYNDFRFILNKSGLEKLGTLYHPTTTVEPIVLEDVQAINHLGNPTALPCPSSRGRYYAKCMDMAKTAIDYGFEHISYDEETYGNGATICFCPRCKEGFKNFLMEKYPSVAYQSPEITVQEPGKHLALEEAWWDYKTDLVAEPYRDLRNLVDSYRNPEGKERRIAVWLDYRVSLEGRYGAIQNRLSDWRKIGSWVDEVYPMLYTVDHEDVYVQARLETELLQGLRAKVVMGLSPNRYYEYFRVESQSFADLGAVHYQILEAAFGGAKGVIFWSHRGAFRGAHDFREIAVASKMLSPVEEIVLHGERVDLEHDNSRIRIDTFKLGNRYALFARNYEAANLRTEIVLPPSVKKMTNTWTGESTDKGSIALSSERAKVFLLE